METVAQLASALRGVGITGQPVIVHSSLRSFGPLSDGAATLSDAFKAVGSTIVVPTFTSEFAVTPPDNLILTQNADGHLATPFEDAGRYDRTTLTVDRSMGAFPQYVLNQPDAVRGGHPLNSFTAMGPDAARIVRASDTTDVYSPIERVIDLNGIILLAGVSYKSMTLLHLAELNAGHALFRRWALSRVGKILEVEIGSCSAGFQKFQTHLDPLVRRRTVGESKWQALDAKAALYAATAAIIDDPSITFCDNQTCRRCEDQKLGGPRERGL